MALNGSLDDYSPAGALRVLSSTGKTGAVRFTGSGGCTVYLNDGQLYFARGDGTDDALATALVRPGRVSSDAWSTAVDDAGDAPQVGELLVEQGAIDSDLLASVVLSVIYDPLITLFREGDGRFDFEPDTMHWIGPSRCFDVEAVVNEVRRRVRNVDEMSDVVPSTSAWVSPVRTLPDGAGQVTLLREDWELIASLSGPRTVDELAMAMGRGRYSTAAVVHRLAVAGLLDVVPEPFSADDDAWNAWSSGNPFEHPAAEADDELPVAFGPSVAGGGFGPESAPDDAMLPRRTAVREADPAERPLDDDALGGLAGITGFHDPTADVLGRSEDAFSLAMAEEPARDPNAAWLENLYAQFIDDSAEVSGKGDKHRKKEALDVAFQAPEQADTEKVGTLKRLAAALRRL